MKRLIPFIALFILAIMTTSCEKERNETFNFTEFPDYFVKNSHQIDNHEEFLILSDTSDFNSVFHHPSTTMDNQIWINPGDFINKVAFGIIKEFNNVCKCPDLTIQSIELIDKKIVFKYTLTGIENTGNIGCDMLCRPNILVMIDRDSFTSIDFYENDNLIKTIYR